MMPDFNSRVERAPGKGFKPGKGPRKGLRNKRFRADRKAKVCEQEGTAKDRGGGRVSLGNSLLGSETHLVAAARLWQHVDM